VLRSPASFCRWHRSRPGSPLPGSPGGSATSGGPHLASTGSGGNFSNTTRSPVAHRAARCCPLKGSGGGAAVALPGSLARWRGLRRAAKPRRCLQDSGASDISKVQQSEVHSAVTPRCPERRLSVGAVPLSRASVAVPAALRHSLATARRCASHAHE